MKPLHVTLGLILCGTLGTSTRAQLEQIYGEVRDESIVIITNESLALGGISIESQAGLILPIPARIGAAPFAFFLANNPNQIIWGNLGSTVDIDGEWLTAARYLGDDPENDLIGSVGNCVGCNFRFTSASMLPSLDCSGDGVTDGGDLACVEDIEHRDAILEELGTVAGDLNGDGLVNFPDFLTLADNFGQTGQSYSEGNINLVGSIDFSDFLVLSENFGFRTASMLDTVSVPETTPGWPAILGAALALCIRRSSPEVVRDPIRC